MTTFELFTSNRPPTPPKDHDKDIDDALDFLAVDYSLDESPEREALKRVTETPPTQPSSPPPSSVDDEAVKEKAIKRVEFSPCVTALNPPTSFLFGTPTKTDSLLKSVVSSRQRRPLRSILKSTPKQLPSIFDPEASPLPPHLDFSDPANLPAMLESVVKMLAASSPSSRLDGYLTLNGALKAYEDLPSPDALKAKMSLLTQFMARDITAATSGKTDPTASSLTSQALKLATALCMIPSLHGCYTEDFQTLLLDKAIQVISSQNVSKTIANHHMYLLASQKFATKLITTTKVEAIVTSLSTIHDRVSGSSVTGVRLVIYQRLIEQNPTAMLNTIRDWLAHVFHAALSSNKDTRTRAIETGTNAGLALGPYYQATKAIIDLFNTSTNDDATYGAYLITRLSAMVDRKDEARHVPQIWSMITLFFRSKKFRITRWVLFKKAWLMILQNCLNNADVEVRYFANLAWNRLVFVISPDLELMNNRDDTVRLLVIPFTAAFEKKVRDKAGKDARKLAESGYCHLLHYALRPSQTFEELDIYWDAYVHQVLSKLYRMSMRDVIFSNRVLKALLNGSSKVWNENLANEAVAMGPEDLPVLDQKWVRLRVQKVLDLVAPHISSVLSDPAENSGIEKTCWQELLTALAEAGSQEVRASAELRDCLAHLVNFITRLWKEASRNFKEQISGLWITRFGNLIQTSVDTLSAMHFSEANLLRNELDSFEAAPTPSHRPSKHHAVMQAPVVAIFGLFARPTAAVDPNAPYFEVAGRLLRSLSKAKISRKSRLHLLRQCSDTITSTPASDSLRATRAGLWCVLARECAAALADSDNSPNAQEPQRLGHQLRDTVHILTIGFEFCTSGSLCLASHLYTTATKLAQQEAGQGAVVLGLAEPVAEALSAVEFTKDSCDLVLILSTLLVRCTWPKNRQQLEEGRKALWNTGLAPARHSIFEPFVHVLTLSNLTLQNAYRSFKDCNDLMFALLWALEDFLNSGPVTQIHSTLRKMQQGLSLWISDQDRHIVGSEGGIGALKSRITSLWRSILALLKSLPANGTLLKALDMLLAAGLNSSHRGIVNETVAFWNETFGQLETLAYPPTIEHALRRIRPLVELELPTFPEDSEEEPSPLVDFVDSQEEPQDVAVETPIKTKPIFSGLNIQGHGTIPATRGTPSRATSSPARHGSSTPRPRRETRTTAKLRHDDSQIEFTAVQSSSPVHEEGTSQLLTEHQKEVISRQHFENAQMYPDFSSSPAPESVRKRPRMPRLDFSGQKVVAEDHTTPTFFNDEHGPMDDYLGSSPTPKAAEKARDKRVSALREETRIEDVEDDSDDIPSSPPQMPEEIEANNVSDQPLAEYEAEVLEKNNNTSSEAVAEDEAEMMDIDTVQDLPGDEVVTTVPDAAGEVEEEQDHIETDVPVEGEEDQDHIETDVPGEGEEEQDHIETDVGQPDEDNAEQTQIEEPAIERAPNTEAPVAAPTEAEGQIELVEAETANVDSSHVAESRREVDDLTEQEHVLPVPVENAVKENGGIEEDAATGTSKIEDSFRETTPAIQSMQSSFADDIGPRESYVQDEQPTMQTRSAKRKRESGSTTTTPMKSPKTTPSKSRQTTTSKSHKTSPLKRMLSWVTGSQEETTMNADEDEEIGDCIVVNSQPERSVATSPEMSAMSASAPPDMEAPKPKRGPGRPRKSQTPVSSTPVQPKLRSLKRDASVLSTTSEKMTDKTPLRKSRRLTRSQDATAARDGEQSSPGIESNELGSSWLGEDEMSQKASSAANDNAKPESEALSGEEDTGQGADSQLRMENEASSSQPTRQMLKPKSILDRLKSILSDCKTMVLRSQEYWELDEVLWEVTKEVREAGRRAKE